MRSCGEERIWFEFLVFNWINFVFSYLCKKSKLEELRGPIVEQVVSHYLTFSYCQICNDPLFSNNRPPLHWINLPTYYSPSSYLFHLLSPPLLPLPLAVSEVHSKHFSIKILNYAISQSDSKQWNIKNETNQKIK